MNQVLRELIQKRVWEKLTLIDEFEYNRHISAAATNVNYPIMTIECKTGHYAYYVDDPPDFTLLEQAVLKGVYEDDNKQQ